MLAPLEGMLERESRDKEEQSREKESTSNLRETLSWLQIV
jgi:hypothetical protein